MLAIEAIRPQLMKLHRYLIAKADESRKKGTKEEMRYTVDSNHCLLQHLDPMLWAARLSGCSSFANIPDSDLSKLSAGGNISFDEELHEEEGGFSSVLRIEPGREV